MNISFILCISYTNWLWHQSVLQVNVCRFHFYSEIVVQLLGLKYKKRVQSKRLIHYVREFQGLSMIITAFTVLSPWKPSLIYQYSVCSLIQSMDFPLHRSAESCAETSIMFGNTFKQCIQRIIVTLIQGDEIFPIYFFKIKIISFLF